MDLEIENVHVKAAACASYCPVTAGRPVTPAHRQLWQTHGVTSQVHQRRQLLKAPSFSDGRRTALVLRST